MGRSGNGRVPTAANRLWLLLVATGVGAVAAWTRTAWLAEADASDGRRQLTTDVVDLIEVNRYFDEHGSPVYQQLIFYDWDEATGRYQVRAFRIIKSLQQIPHRVPGSRFHAVVWFDEKDGVTRRVLARAVRQSWTQHDPEMAERDAFPVQYRRELSLPPRRPRR